MGDTHGHWQTKQAPAPSQTPFRNQNPNDTFEDVIDCAPPPPESRQGITYPVRTFRL